MKSPITLLFIVFILISPLSYPDEFETILSNWERSDDSAYLESLGIKKPIEELDKTCNQISDHESYVQEFLPWFQKQIALHGLKNSNARALFQSKGKITIQINKVGGIRHVSVKPQNSKTTTNLNSIASTLPKFCAFTDLMKKDTDILEIIRNIQ